MGKESSKILDILFVTGADLDPPGTYDSHKTEQTQQVKIDYRLFKPKKYYKVDATDPEIQQQLKKLKKKEDLMKRFKYNQDFQRIDFKVMDLNAGTFEVVTQQGIKMGILLSFFLSRGYQVYTSIDYFTVAGWARYFFPVLLMMTPLIVGKFLFAPQYHIANHEYFRIINQETALKQQFDLNFDLYKDVKKMKYSFKYPSVSEYYKTKRSILDRGQYAAKGTSKEYYEYYNGIKLDKYEEFIKRRQQERKQSSQLINQHQKQLIIQDISNKSK